MPFDQKDMRRMKKTEIEALEPILKKAPN